MTTMTTREIIDELARISRCITADHANPRLDPGQSLVRACMEIESLRALLIEDLRRAADGATSEPAELSWIDFYPPPPPPFAQLHFDSSISPEDMAAVEGYVAERYGLWSLPADDPPAESWRDRPPLL